MPDNAENVEAAMRMVEGTARNVRPRLAWLQPEPL